MRPSWFGEPCKAPYHGALLEHLGRLQSQIDTNESHLSVRGAWLAKIALARLAKGDVLSLAEPAIGSWIDFAMPVLPAISISPPSCNSVRPVPATASSWFATGCDRDRIFCGAGLFRWPMPARARKTLRPILDAVQSVGLKPEIPNTCAYADLMLAWGLARLRDAEDVDPLVEQRVENFRMIPCMRS